MRRLFLLALLSASLLAQNPTQDPEPPADREPGLHPGGVFDLNINYCSIPPRLPVWMSLVTEFRSPGQFSPRYRHLPFSAAYSYVFATIRFSNRYSMDWWSVPGCITFVPADITLVTAVADVMEAGFVAGQIPPGLPIGMRIFMQTTVWELEFNRLTNSQALIVLVQ